MVTLLARACVAPRTRHFLTSLLVVLLLPPGMARASDPVTERRRALGRTSGTIDGRVTDAKTGEPLEDVHVSAQYLGDETDAAGAFRIVRLAPGVAEVSAWRRDYVEQDRQEALRAGLPGTRVVNRAGEPT